MNKIFIIFFIFCTSFAFAESKCEKSILEKYGATPIEEIKIGERVLACNLEKSECEYRDVINVFETRCSSFFKKIMQSFCSTNGTAIPWHWQ